MELKELVETVKIIVEKSNEIKDKHTSEENAPVSYACIFSHSEEEFNLMVKLTHNFGTIIKETSAGPIFQINPIETVAGVLELLKIRKPYANKPELGYADFALKNYQEFKKKYLHKENFKLIVREDYEIIGIKDSSLNSLAYFAYPPLDQQLNIN